MGRLDPRVGRVGRRLQAQVLPVRLQADVRADQGHHLPDRAPQQVAERVRVPVLQPLPHRVGQPVDLLAVIELGLQGAVDEAVDWLAPRIDPRPPVLRLVPVEGFEILGEAHLRGDGHAHGPAASAIAMPASVSRVSTACCASTSARAAEVGLAGKGHGRVIEHKVNGCSPGM